MDLAVVAYTGMHSDLCVVNFYSRNVSEVARMTIEQNNRRQFSLMLQQVCSDSKYAEYTGLAIRVAYEMFWHSGERQSFC